MAKRQKTFNPVNLWSANFSTVLSISLVLFMLGFMSLFVFHAFMLSNNIKENVSFTVYLIPNAEEQKAMELKNEIGKKAIVKTTEYVSPYDAAQMMNEIMGEDHLMVLDSVNPYPASIVVNLKAQALNMSDIKGFITSVEAKEIVDNVDYRYDLIQDINTMIYNITGFILAFIICLLVISITLINHTIRLTIYSKRFLIRSMELVGAKPSIIRKPFLLKGFYFGLIGGFVANIILAVILYWVFISYPEIVKIDYLPIYGIIAGGVWVFGIIIAFIFTLFSVIRFMHLRAEKLYK